MPLLSGGGVWYGGRMKPQFWLVLAAVVLAPLGFISFGIIFRLGVEASFQKYGTEGTIGMVATIVPLLIVLGFLFDRRQNQIQGSREDHQ